MCNNLKEINDKVNYIFNYALKYIYFAGLAENSGIALCGETAHIMYARFLLIQKQYKSASKWTLDYFNANNGCSKDSPWDDHVFLIKDSNLEIALNTTLSCSSNIFDQISDNSIVIDPFGKTPYEKYSEKQNLLKVHQGGCINVTITRLMNLASIQNYFDIILQQGSYHFLVKKIVNYLNAYISLKVAATKRTADRIFLDQNRLFTYESLTFNQERKHNITAFMENRKIEFN